MSEAEKIEIKRSLKILNDSFDEIIKKISKTKKNNLTQKKGVSNGKRNI